jgi:CobQ-like glutamine amidotransferase family enzyme
MDDRRVKIGWFFPDTLYLHGERGNLFALKKMLEAAGFNPEIEKINFSTPDFDPMSYDFLFCPPGEITNFSEIIEFLKPKKDLLRAFMDFGGPLLVTGTSIGLWGKAIHRQDGSTVDGLDVIDVEAFEKEKVYGDDLFYDGHLEGCSHPIFGSQIQLVDLKLGTDTKPFGSLHYGYGNTGKDTSEGVILDHAVFTNTLGPILVLNPWLTYAFVRIIAARKEIALPEGFQPDTVLEEASFLSKVDYTAKKTTRLTNCEPLKSQLQHKED